MNSWHDPICSPGEKHPQQQDQMANSPLTAIKSIQTEVIFSLCSRKHLMKFVFGSGLIKWMVVFQSSAIRLRASLWRCFGGVLPRHGRIILSLTCLANRICYGLRFLLALWAIMLPVLYVVSAPMCVDLVEQHEEEIWFYKRVCPCS